jgi:transposase
MHYFVGLDVSKKTTHICAKDWDGSVVETGAVKTEPKAIAAFLRGQRPYYVPVGAEAWATTSWLLEGLANARFPIVLIESRHAHGVLKSQPDKTDRNDARGIAELMRIGVYRAVHVKRAASQEIRMMLAARAMLTLKAQDVANFIRSVLLGAGFKLVRFQRRTCEARVRTFSRAWSHLGLTPCTYQSGDVEWRGRITRSGDGALRRALVTAAMTSLKKNTSESWLKVWARGVAERRGAMKAGMRSPRSWPSSCIACG